MDSLDPDLLRESLEESVDSLIFERGMRYYSAHRVHSIEILPDPYSLKNPAYIRVSGVVKGSRTYKTTLGIEENAVTDFGCTCPYDPLGNDPCKHVIALGLTFADSLAPKQRGVPAKISASTTSLQEKQHEEERMRQKLREIGIDVALLPESVVQNLITATQPQVAKRASPFSPSKTLPAPKPQKPFNERYFLSVESYRREVWSLKLTSHAPQKTWYPFEQLSLTHIRNENTLTDDEDELITLLETHQTHSYEQRRVKGVDMVRVFSLARESGVRIKHSADHTPARPVAWTEPVKLTTALSLEKRSSLYGDHAYQAIIFALTGSTPQEIRAAGAGVDGLVLFRKDTVELHTMPTILAKNIARAVKRDSFDVYSQYQPAEEDLPHRSLYESDYEHINALIDACKKHTDCDIQVASHYAIVHHKPEPVMVVDYLSKEKTLSVRPAVTYGPATLAVCDTNYYSTSYGNNGITRRKEEAFGKTSVVHIEGNTIHITPVAEKIEKTLFKLGLQKSETLGISKKGRLAARGDKQIAFAAETYLPKIKALGYKMVYPHDMLNISTATFNANFDIDFNAENDWLAFNMELYCGEERVQLSDIEACIASGTDMLTLPDGRILRITNIEAMKRIIEMLVHFRKNATGQYEGRSYNAPELDAVATGSPHYSARVSEGFRAFIKEARSGKMVKTVRIPKPFAGVLRDYQVQGVHWLHFLHHYRFAGILADDMGLGKTLQALTILSIHASDKKPSLIVAPKTLLHNWETEVHTFAPHLKTIIIDGTQAEREELIKTAKKQNLLITSYPALQKDIAVYEKHKIAFNYCVIDEAQYIKNPRTKNAHMVRRVQSDYRLALTGTPLENSVEEIWSSFDFLMPGFLGHHAHFQKHIGNPIMKQANSDAMNRLQTKVQCFMLRRTKEEVLKELPAKVEQVIQCDLSDEQNILYQDVLRRVKNDIETQVTKKGFAGSQIHILAGLTRLRQICNHPALVLPEKKRGVYPSAKLDACMEIIERMHREKRKVLVFSQFTKMLDILEKELNARGIAHSYLSGETKNRKEVVHEFIDDSEKTVFLISTKTGGVGLNLTVADAVIIFDPWWNPQVERQAVDRTHRIGQEKVVHVYRLRTVGTIEEKIAKLQERKQNLFNALVGDSKDLFKKLTWEDVKALLSL